MVFVPSYGFRQYVERCNGDYRVKTFSRRDQILRMAVAQLPYRNNLRNVKACLRVANQHLQ
ncbi:MAG: DUF4372 domain-containing protein [Nitrospirae bacterium]|nr:DUF4372 domain-containing protein [Nitrospirota bacterium]NTW65951.1 DUF4372 domain-containing protein [Nitrospirota bacterium]